MNICEFNNIALLDIISSGVSIDLYPKSIRYWYTLSEQKMSTLSVSWANPLITNADIPIIAHSWIKWSGNALDIIGWVIHIYGRLKLQHLHSSGLVCWSTIIRYITDIRYLYICIFVLLHSKPSLHHVRFAYFFDEFMAGWNSSIFIHQVWYVDQR